MEMTAAIAMDRMYRRQRYVYDFTRRYYLLGRDLLIRRLNPASGDHVLEIGCGTGRNLVAAARRYKDAQFLGIDISREMLKSSGRAIAQANLQSRVRVAFADAADIRSQRAVRAAEIRAHLHFLQLVDDSRLAACARRRGAAARRRWRIAHRRFRATGAPAALVPQRFATMARAVSRASEGRDGADAHGAREPCQRTALHRAAVSWLCAIRRAAALSLKAAGSGA